MPIHFGLQLHPQHCSWDELRDFAKVVDDLGYDSLMTWDHFVPLYGDVRGPNLEGWQVLAAWGALTTRVRIGMLVTGNTYRHPAVLANMAATLDHVTNGRVILGIGAAWHEAEHRMYGIPFDTVPIRLAKLRESVRVLRSLTRRERTTFEGAHYRLEDARLGVRPVQEAMPILIGGGGEQVTLRVTARYADIWHGFGAPDVIAHKIGVLRRHCEEVGRDAAEILPTTGGTILIRETEEGLQKRLRELQARHRHPSGSAPASPLAGVPGVDAWVERLHEHWRAGARGFIFGMGAPFDRESAERLIGEVKPRLEALVSG